MNLLLTGGTGFLGKNLVTQIKKQSNLLIITRKKVKSKNKNLKYLCSNFKLKKDIIEKIKNFAPKVLIHMAWQDIPDYSKIKSKKNYIDQKFFFEEILKIKTLRKIIITGSCSEKDNNYKLTSYYHVLAKKKLYKFLQSKCKKKQIDLIWLRLFFVFGKHQSKRSLIPYLIENIKKGKKIHLKNPEAINDFIDVKNVASTIKEIIFRFNRSAILDLGSGYGCKVIDIQNFIENIKLNKKLILKKYKKNSFIADIKKTYKIVKVKKFKNIEDSLILNYRNP